MSMTSQKLYASNVVGLWWLRFSDAVKEWRNTYNANRAIWGNYSAVCDVTQSVDRSPYGSYGFVQTFHFVWKWHQIYTFVVIPSVECWLFPQRKTGFDIMFAQKRRHILMLVSLIWTLLSKSAFGSGMPAVLKMCAAHSDLSHTYYKK